MEILDQPLFLESLEFLQLEATWPVWSVHHRVQYLVIKYRILRNISNDKMNSTPFVWGDMYISEDASDYNSKK